jgi:hypothetical protein
VGVFVFYVFLGFGLCCFLIIWALCLGCGLFLFFFFFFLAGLIFVG